MQIPRWQNVLILKNSIKQSTMASTHFAAFHTTTTLCEKWGNKWNSHERRDKQPPKNYIRYKARQKRADAKKALNKLLYNIGGDKDPFQDIRKAQKVEGSCNWFPDANDYTENSSHRKGRPKYSQHRKSHSKNKCKVRREGFYEDFGEYTETVFSAMFGKRWCTWSFNYWQGSFVNSRSSFDWRGQTDWRKRRSGKWEAESDVDSDDEDEPCSVGSPSDRSILGLPATGPLKLEEVKDAFRKAAMKWHPDKHQGLSQDMAGEKFKLCVNAYQSLCSALSPG